MGKSLFDYASENTNIDEPINNDNNFEQEMKKNIDKYKDLSSDELQQELFSEVSKQKQNGSFDYSSLANSVNTISPYLSQDQRERLENLLERIK